MLKFFHFEYYFISWINYETLKLYLNILRIKWNKYYDQQNQINKDENDFDISRV
jgi:hypothetical protein